jgi:hypothetical protein
MAYVNCQIFKCQHRSQKIFRLWLSGPWLSLCITSALESASLLEKHFISMLMGRLLAGHQQSWPLCGHQSFARERLVPPWPLCFEEILFLDTGVSWNPTSIVYWIIFSNVASSAKVLPAFMTEILDGTSIARNSLHPGWWGKLDNIVKIS